MPVRFNPVKHIFALAMPKRIATILRMETYAKKLDDWVKREGNSEIKLANAVSLTQASINRYRNGIRLPSSRLALLIDTITSGEVPYATWRQEFLEREGIVL